MNFKTLSLAFVLIFNITLTAAHVIIDHHEEHHSQCELCMNTELKISQNNVVFNTNILNERIPIVLAKVNFLKELNLFQFKRAPPKSFNV